jgi:predicted transcriptional regulator
VWNRYLVAKLLEVGFVQSEQDECLFYKGQVVYALYTDNSLLCGAYDKELDDILKQMEAVGLKLASEIVRSWRFSRSKH